MMADLVFLAERYIWPLGGAAGLGLLVGALTCSVRPPGLYGKVSALLALAALVALVSAVGSGAVRGRAGLALDIAAGLALAYVLGCLAGCLCRAALSRLRDQAEASPPTA
ncbi:MAG: hypothetical protein JO048_09555 [Methylobacteriaceae bacterium]|nr:hypothetical protein [Methylobacteriaceae bacterium]